MIINQSLFGSKINKETTLGTDGHFLSPFGPQFLYLTLDDEIRLKLLQSVANFRKDTSQLNPRVFLKYADLGYKAQKNSINSKRTNSKKTNSKKTNSKRTNSKRNNFRRKSKSGNKFPKVTSIKFTGSFL